MVFKVPSFPNPSVILFYILNSSNRRETFALKWNSQFQKGDIQGHCPGPFGTSCWRSLMESCPSPTAGTSQHEELNLPCQGFALPAQEGPSPCNCPCPSLTPRDTVGHGEGCPHCGTKPSTASARSTRCHLPQGRLGCKKKAGIPALITGNRCRSAVVTEFVKLNTWKRDADSP